MVGIGNNCGIGIAATPTCTTKTGLARVKVQSQGSKIGLGRDELIGVGCCGGVGVGEWWEWLGEWFWINWGGGIARIIERDNCR